jgi:hypothetical protein
MKLDGERLSPVTVNRPPAKDETRGVAAAFVGILTLMVSRKLAYPVVVNNWTMYAPAAKDVVKV